MRSSIQLLLLLGTTSVLSASKGKLAAIGPFATIDTGIEPHDLSQPKRKRVQALMARLKEETSKATPFEIAFNLLRRSEISEPLSNEALGVANSVMRTVGLKKRLPSVDVSVGGGSDSSSTVDYGIDDDEDEHHGHQSRYTIPPKPVSNTATPTVVNGRGTLPPIGKNDWLKVDKTTGTTLLYPDGTTYRPVGSNIYWLCNDENIQCLPKGYYTDKSRIREALAAAVAMGSNTVRIHTCGISHGFPQAIETDLDVFGTDEQLDIHDYAIYAAGQYGLRAIVPLSDQYDYYHGGKYTFLRWLNVSTDNFGNEFYTNDAVLKAFERYITFVMTRVNKYTGLAYKDDPTIAIWENGNEWGAFIGKQGYPPLSFTDRTGKLIKKLAPKALFMDGTDGFYNYTTKEVAPGLKSKYVDIMTDHAYYRNLDLFNVQYNLTRKHKKVFLIGEADWTDDFGGANLTTYLVGIYSATNVGFIIWSLFTRTTNCKSFVTHDDGYALYYPEKSNNGSINPNTDSQKTNVKELVQFFYNVTGREVPTSNPDVICPQPQF